MNNKSWKYEKTIKQSVFYYRDSYSRHNVLLLRCKFPAVMERHQESRILACCNPVTVVCTIYNEYHCMENNY